MRYSLPDFEGLAMFAKVVEARSFAGAARSLGISVATVSRAVTRLEERLGSRVLNRSSRQVVLTEFGRSLAADALALLRDAEQAENAARELAGSPSGTVRLAAPMSFGLQWVAPLLPRFLAQYPDLTLDLHLTDATTDLVGESFDAALRIAVLPDSSLVARRLCPMARFLVASPRYVERRGRPLSPGDLDERDCFGYAYRARSDVWKLVHADGSEATVSPKGRLRVTNADALIPPLLAGLGVAELPEFIANRYLKTGELERLLPDWALPEGGLYFVLPSGRAKASKVQALGDFFQANLTDCPWRST